MTPYYDKGGITIWLGDCRDVLPTLPAGSVDLVLTDPPYNSGITYGAGTNDSRNDYWEWLGERIALINQTANTVLIKHSALKVAKFMTRWPGRILVWYKPFSSGFPLNGVATHWEPIHWLKGKAVKWSKDVFVHASGNHRDTSTGHPAQFPEALASWLITTFAAPDGTVLDPFMGSGTTLRAAKDAGLKAIGIEIEERYCEIAARRLEQEVFTWEETP